jgi:hypothetical protein
MQQFLTEAYKTSDILNGNKRDKEVQQQGF